MVRKESEVNEELDSEEELQAWSLLKEGEHGQ